MLQYEFSQVVSEADTEVGEETEHTGVYWTQDEAAAEVTSITEHSWTDGPK